MTLSLPIDPLLPELVGTLERACRLVLVAPPGAGKTTRVPPALLDGCASGGELLVLEPRRVAARAAARRVAAERGGEVGGEVGYRVRLDARAGPETRLTFVTGGVLARRLQSDPLLEGVAAVILDEVHERSLEADLVLAMVAHLQRELRPELMILAMSATLEAGPLAAYLGGCPVLEAAGRRHPVQVRHAAGVDERPLAVRVAGAVARVLADPADDGGHVLVFLPGAAEIRRTAEALAPVAARHGLRVLPLHGDMEAAAQDEALAPSGPRKVILATNVAETSLTIDGVTTVVDSGLVKQLRHDPRRGLDRLELRPISRASATQRAGRAGRTAPGRVVRLWTREDHLGRPARDLPEVRRADLAAAVLAVRAWGADPAAFPWLEPPPAAALERADGLLRRLGAVDDHGVTRLGRQMLRVPLHPRLARMLVAAHGAGCLTEGARLAALASERDVLGSARAFGDVTGSPLCNVVGASDLLARLELLEEAAARGGSDAALRGLGLDPRGVRRVRVVAQQLETAARRALGDAPRRAVAEPDLLGVLLSGFADRVALRRAPGGSRLVLVGGREAELDAGSVVWEGSLLVAHQVEDAPAGRAARVRLASQVTVELLAEVLPGAVWPETVLVFDKDAQRVVARRLRRYADLVLEQTDVAVADRAAAGALLARHAASDPRRALALDAEAAQWLARERFLAHHLPEAELPALDGVLPELTAELCQGLLSFEELRRLDVGAALRARLGHAGQRLVDREAPDRLAVPSGSRIALRYPETPPGAPPVLAVRIQELFGLTETPRVARGRVAVVLHLLSPGQRPVQVTQDLESFWRRGYPEVRRELQGRYPKHAWPVDPLTATPTRRTRRGRPSGAGQRPSQKPPRKPSPKPKPKAKRK